MDVPDLSAIVLCYRAGGSIRRVIEPLHDQLCQSGIAFELILVANYDPGAADTTPAVVEEFASRRAEARTVIEPKRGAMGWDMRSGFEAARGEIMIVIDGDDQNPVEDVLRMYRRMRETQVDVMKGRRIARFDPHYRRLVSFFYNLLFMVLFRSGRLWDMNGKPKGLTRDAYERMQLSSNDWFIDAEIVLSALRKEMRIAELPVIFHSNEERASFVRPGAAWEFLRNMVRYALRRDT